MDEHKKYCVTTRIIFVLVTVLFFGIIVEIVTRVCLTYKDDIRSLLRRSAKTAAMSLDLD